MPVASGFNSLILAPLLYASDKSITLIRDIILDGLGTGLYDQEFGNLRIFIQKNPN